MHKRLTARINRFIRDLNYPFGYQRFKEIDGKLYERKTVEDIYIFIGDVDKEMMLKKEA